MDKSLTGVFLSATPNRFATATIKEFLVRPYYVDVTKSSEIKLLEGIALYYAEVKTTNKNTLLNHLI